MLDTRGSPCLESLEVSTTRYTTRRYLEPFLTITSPFLLAVVIIEGVNRELNFPALGGSRLSYGCKEGDRFRCRTAAGEVPCNWQSVSFTPQFHFQSHRRYANDIKAPSVIRFERSFRNSPSRQHPTRTFLIGETLRQQRAC